MPGPVFQRFGRSHHLRIQSADDLRLAAELDEAHWVATGAPVSAFNADAVLLAALDADRDGRIRAADVKRAIRWMFSLLPSAEPGATELAVREIDRSTPDGRNAHTAATRIDPGNGRVSLEQVRATRRAEERKGLSEAGLVLPAAAEDDAVRQLVQDVLSTVGGAPHPLGEPAVSDALLDRFLTEAVRYLAWWDEGRTESASTVMPLGPDTDAASAAWETVREKIDAWFVLCDAVRLQPALGERLWPGAAGVDYARPDDVRALLHDAPLDRPTAEGALDLLTPANPAWAERLRAFRDTAAVPLLKRQTDTLTREDWAAICRALQPHADWLAQRPEVAVGALPASRLRAIVSDPDAIARLRALITASHEGALVIENVRLLERLLLLQAHLMRFANSFVSFPDLYDPDSRALFERGSLVMDGRIFTMAVVVGDRERHARYSDASNMFVLYVEVMDTVGTVLYEVAVPVTSGGRGNLLAEKWGIFHDLDGRQLHARVVRVVDNPISLWEAISAPFKRMGKAITTTVDRLGAQRAEALEQQGAASVLEVQKAIEEGGPEEAPPPESPSAAPGAAAAGVGAGGMLAGGGIAVAAVSSSVAYVAQVVQRVGWQEITGGLLAAAAAVIVPVAVVAWLRLRQRDLSAILEGSGWGLNGRMRLTRAQARSFTRRPPWPAGARRVRGRRTRLPTRPASR